MDHYCSNHEMPKRRIPRTPRKTKRRRVTRRGRMAPRRLFPRVRALQPKTQMRVLNYATNFTMSGAGVSTQSLRANSLFDPDFTSVLGDHQPKGFDQIKAMYHEYTVVRSTIRVRFVRMRQSVVEHLLVTGSNAGEANALHQEDGLHCTLSLSKDSSNYPLLGSADGITQEDNLSKDTWMPGGGYGSGRSTLTHTFNGPKFYGQSVAAYTADNDKGADVSTNPVDSPLFTIQVLSVSGQTRILKAYVWIKYYVLFHEPKLMGQS